MRRIDIDEAIRLHTYWRRQFLNAFAGGDYADMPLSEHRSCTLDQRLGKITEQTPLLAQLQATHQQFHVLASEVVNLSNNGLGDAADLLLPELNEASHQLVARLDELRAQIVD